MGMMFTSLKQFKILDRFEQSGVGQSLLSYGWSKLALIVAICVIRRYLSIFGYLLDAIEHSLIVSCSSLIVLRYCFLYERSGGNVWITRINSVNCYSPVALYLIHPIIVTIFCVQFNVIIWNHENKPVKFMSLYLLLLIFYYLITYSIAILLTRILIRRINNLKQKIRSAILKHD